MNSPAAMEPSIFKAVVLAWRRQFAFNRALISHRSKRAEGWESNPFRHSSARLSMILHVLLVIHLLAGCSLGGGGANYIHTRCSLASRGVDGWYLGLSLDHYQCNLFDTPKTQAYCISGLTELFPQIFQLPNMSLHQQLCALTDELAESTAITCSTAKGRHLLKLLQSSIAKNLKPLHQRPLPGQNKGWVTNNKW